MDHRVTIEYIEKNILISTTSNICSMEIYSIMNIMILIWCCRCQYIFSINLIELKKGFDLKQTQNFKYVGIEGVVYTRELHQSWQISACRHKLVV